MSLYLRHRGLAGRVRELEERYARPLPVLEHEVEALSAKVEEQSHTDGRATMSKHLDFEHNLTVRGCASRCLALSHRFYRRYAGIVQTPSAQLASHTPAPSIQHCVSIACQTTRYQLAAMLVERGQP